MKKLFLFLAAAGIFVSCTPEEIETAFEVDAAVATIEVKVYDVNDPTVQVSSTEYTVSASTGTVDGSTVTLTGNKSLAATTVNITVSYDGETYDAQPVEVARLLAGGVASYVSTAIVGKVDTPDPDVPDVDRDIRVTSETEDPVYNYYYFVPYSGHSHAYAYTHDGKTIDSWASNLSEFYLEDYADYTAFTGTKVSDVERVSDAFPNLLEDYATALESYEEEDDVYEFTVSAWAYYTVEQTVATVKTTYTLYVGEEVIGTYVGTSYSTSVELIEIANPLGHGHYVQGHGHAHGGNMNAGGGIISAE